MNMKRVALLGVSISCLCISNAYAQENQVEDQEVDEIVVTGIRQVLNDGINAKKDAPQVLDALSLGEVGQLPTISIADSLEFLPGVIGTRFRGNVDQISVRGLPQLFTQSTVNGRELTSGNGNRYVRYRIYPAQFFEKAELVKSPLPDQVEGGIAGSINLQTYSPLLHRGPSVRGDIRLQRSPFNNNNDLTKSTGARVNVLVNKQFENAKGDSGFTLGFDYMDNPIVIGQGFAPAFSSRPIRGQRALVPNAVIFSNDTEDFKRYSGLAAWEWRGANGIDLKLDAILTHAKNDQKRTQLQIANLNAPNRYVSAVVENGQLQTASLRNLLIFSRFEDLDRTDDALMLGGNIKIDRGGWLSEIDGYFSKTDVDFQLYRPIFRSRRNTVDLDLTNGFFEFSNFGSDLADPSNFGAHQVFAFDRQIQDKAYGLRLETEHDLNFGIFNMIRLGGRWSRRDINSLELRSIDNSVRNARLFPQFAFGALDASLFSAPNIDFDLSGSIDGVFPTPFVLFNRDAARAALPAPVFEVNNSDLLNRSIDNTENTLAAFVRTDFESTAGNTPFSGVLGLRVVNTKLTARGFSGDPVAVTDPVTGAVTIQVAGDLVAATEKNSYTEWLPSLNVKFDLRDDLALRFGAARTLARADFLDLRLAQSLNGGDVNSQPFTGSAGNPGLKPVLSNQVDLSLEWYPKEGTAFSVGAYYKDVSGFIIGDVRQATIGGYAYELSAPINADDGKFLGLEFYFRHDLDYLPGLLDGLGVLATATFNKTNLDIDYGILNDTDAAGSFIYNVADRDPGVEGLAKRTASGILFYEKGPVSLRFSARYVSDRVRSTGSLNVPIVSKGRTLLDAAASYKLTDNVKLQFQALNLSEQADEAYFAFNNYAAVNQQIGRVYYLGASFNF